MLRRRSNAQKEDRTPDSSASQFNVRRSHAKSPSSLYDLPSFRPSHVFLSLIVVRLIASFTSPIADCDEVFNYWEPMHFLLFRYGFQTWEYSPQFALRSYAYLYPYAGIASVINLLYTVLSTIIPFFQTPSPKLLLFFSVRAAQAALSSFVETALFSATYSTFGSNVASLFFLLSLPSPGIFRASVEFLPSSFSMLCLTAAYAYWLNNSLNVAVFLVALASLLGWIFAAVLGFPIALSLLMAGPPGWRQLTQSAFFSGVVIVLVMTAIDSAHYGRLAFAPLNHILYNVFPKEGTGSQLYGVESWSFYVNNLVLNCNFSALIFAIYPALLFLLTISGHLSREAVAKRFYITLAPMAALIVFFLQPHKEERFLAPCYTLITLVAALGLGDALNFLKAVAMKTRIVFFRIGFLGVLMVLLGSFVLGLSRTGMQVVGFGAPLDIYRLLSEQELRSDLNSDKDSQRARDMNVCVGKEWYRFPSSFFLPSKRNKLRFVRDGFTGLLPRPYVERADGTSVFRDGIFNEFNMEAEGQFFEPDKDGTCDFWVDFDMFDSGNKISAFKEDEFDVVAERSFLDSAASKSGRRAFFIPGVKVGVQYGRYVLARRKERQVLS